MDLIESIKIFKSVAETRSFSITAKNFRVTQPTVSKAISALEEKLQVTLMRRSTRGVNLTPEGERLILAGVPLLDQLDVMLASVRSDKLQLRGQLRVSCTLAFARLILVPLLKPFYERHPDLRIELILSDSFIDLVENNLDLSIRVGGVPDKTINKIPIGEVKRLLYATADYIDLFGVPLTLEDLRTHRLLHYSRFTNPPSWPLKSKMESPESYYFEPYFQTDSSDLLREVTLSGLGIALLPTWMVLANRVSADLVKVLPEAVESTAPICVYTNQPRGLSARQQAFVEFLQEEFAKLGS